MISTSSAVTADTSPAADSGIARWLEQTGKSCSFVS